MKRPTLKKITPRTLTTKIKAVKTAFIFGLASLSFTSAVSALPQNALPFTSDGASFIAPTSNQIALEVSKGTLVRLDRPATEIFIADPDIADIQVKSQRIIYIFGKARGETSFYALDENDEIIYSSNVNVTQSLTLLRQTLKELLPDLAIEARMMGSMVLLKGYVSSPSEATTADSMARRLMGDAYVVNQLTVLQPTQVNLRVRFAEVSRNILKELGVSWETFYNDSSFGIGLSQGRDVFNLIPDASTGLLQKQFIRPTDVFRVAGEVATGGLDLNYAIDALDNEGFLTVLAEPNLTTQTGQTANFLAGGEFPVPIPSRDGLGIEFREFGVALEFTPTVLDSGRITMRIKPEVSDLSTAGAIQVDGISVPSLTTRKAETTVELGSGQSFAIAGLLQNQITQTADKFPGLGDLPIIGALFRSERFRRQETELLIVVTPYLVRPVSDRKLALPTDGFLAPTDVDRYLKGERWQANSPPKATARAAAKGPDTNKRAGFRLN